MGIAIRGRSLGISEWEKHPMELGMPLFVLALHFELLVWSFLSECDW